MASIDPFFSNLCILFVVGIISGLLSSIPPGATNIWLIRSTLPPQRTAREQSSFIAGITIMDALYALIALCGYYFVLKGTIISFFLIIISSLVLCILGISDLYNLNKNRKVTDYKPLVQRSPLESFVMGIILGINPGFIVFWLLVVQKIEEIGIQEISTLYSIAFASGIVLSDIGWYAFLIRISRKGASLVSGNILNWVRIVVACSFIVIGLMMLSDINKFME